MTDCMEREIQDLLPDVLHGTLDGAERARVETHVAGCGYCREELEVLRAVQSAAVFTPSVDVAGIVRKIPPYAVIVPAVERPARSPVMRWLVAAGLAVVAMGGGSALLTHGDGVEQARIGDSAPAHSLALTSGLEELSDGGLVQLMNEMSTFDALPANEPEPVFTEDASTPMDGDSL